jgi:hypothetical protein
MNANGRRYAAGILAASILVTIFSGLAPLGSRAQAQDLGVRPITSSNFIQAAPRGFGDRNNSWAQSMVWWRNNLYVGTSRQSLCTSLYSIWQFVNVLIDKPFADQWFPYPPNDPDLLCAPDPDGLQPFAIQAEIWRWTPGTGTWSRVFQSPADLPNPGPGSAKFVPLDPANPLLPVGPTLPYEIAIRGMTPYKEANGTEALYAFGINGTVMSDREQLPPPRILRSTDGNTFAPVPQTPGTFLGDLPFNADHSSFRSPVSYGGKLFVLSGPIFGQGSLIGSADPARGDNAWFLAAPPQLQFYELAVFNGWLYLGSFDPNGGYSVLKTRAEGTPPYTFITVVPGGAYLQVRPSKSVVSMHEYLGRLYVGTATYTEIIRINPDDTWDLVVGSPRQVPLPGGGSEWKYPLSGLDAGFGHTLNDHAWQMDDPYRYLYVGTYNASIGSKNDPVNGPKLLHNMGAHLYRTRDGWYYSPITTDGFSNLGDPHGGRFDYGIRTMATTPHGIFLGTANDYYGLMILRANTRGSNAPDSTGRLEIEPTIEGSALLSWLKAPGNKQYQIWRAEIHPILVRDDLNFEAWNGATGNKIPDTYIGPYLKIGESTDPFFIDSTVQPGKRYMYYVVVEDKKGRVSDPSNLVAFPLLTPPVTFAKLLLEVDRLDERQRFQDPAIRLTRVRQVIVDAQTLALECQIDDAIATLTQLQDEDSVLVSDVRQPEAIDLEILVAKLVRRLELFDLLPQDVDSDEFCTAPQP